MLFKLIRSSIGSQSDACTTPPKQSKSMSKWLLKTPQGSSPCHKTVRVNSPVSGKTSQKSLQFDVTLVQQLPPVQA